MAELRGERAGQFLETSCNRIAEDSTGWEVLFREMDSTTLWVQAYPNSEMHGGGEMLVTEITEREARERFGSF
jgi:hypothetical protein